MDKYLIVSDLDGTLLNHKRKIPRKSIRYIKKLVKQGHFFVFATGRPYQGSIRYYKKLKLTGPMICDNGGSIHFPRNHNQDIFTVIPLDLFISLVKEIKPYLFAGMSSHFDTVYYYNEKDVPFFLKHPNPPREIIEGDLEEIMKKPPINPTLFFKNKYLDEVLNILSKDEYKDIISYRYWNDYSDTVSLELYHKNATKGHALLKLKEILNINKENDLVFGDQKNDIEMLSYAFNSVAMLNGRKEVKEITKYITYKTNKDNGVTHFIKEFFKTKKAPN